MQKALEILVAEHDRDVAEGLCDVLDLAGHKVYQAHTVEETFELLRLHDFHVAFVNVKLEGCSKLESFAEVRKIKPGANLVMMSAHTIDQLTMEVTDGGMVKVLSAPDEVDTLVDALDAVGPAGTLLIEDVPANFGATLQAAFRDRDVNLAIAHDRDEALTQLAAASSDVLLLDLRLNASRRLEVYLEVRRPGHAIPIIIFQSYAEDPPADNDILHGGILFKPFDPAYMVKLLEDMAVDLYGGSAARAPVVSGSPDAGPPDAGPPDAGAPDIDDRADEYDTPRGAEAADANAGEVLIWEDSEQAEAPPAEPDRMLGVGGAMSSQASEPEHAPDPRPSTVPAPDHLSEPPPPAIQAPVQADHAEAPPAEPDRMLGVGGAMSSQASEPEHAPDPRPSTVPAPDHLSEPSPPAIQEPVQAEQAQAGRPESGITGMSDEESPSEAKLPAGIGLSVEQLEQAVSAAEDSESRSDDDPPAGASGAPVPSAEEFRVLVVDDDEDMAEGLAEILDDTGLVVEVAHSSEAALATLEQFEANIALVDIQLGRNSGIELIPNLKKLRPDLIVVMVTAQTEQQTAIEALRRGAFDYLNKPLHPEELLAALDRCFDDLAKRAPRAAVPAAPSAAPADSKPAGAEYMAKLSQKLGTAHSPVVGFSEVLSEEMLDSPVASHYAEDAGDSLDASGLLESVIGDFTDIDRGESGKVEIYDQEVDLTRTIFRCLKLVQPAASASELTVEIELAEIPVFIIGDRYKLTQILLGLLVNAIKFTPSHGKIRIILERDDDGAVVILVKDTGPGIADATRAQALSPVIGSDGELAPSYRGNGLSLPLAGAMAALHGGVLRLDSEAEGGTTATLQLPAGRNIAPKRAVAV